MFEYQRWSAIIDDRYERDDDRERRMVDALRERMLTYGQPAYYTLELRPMNGAMVITVWSGSGSLQGVLVGALEEPQLPAVARLVLDEVLQDPLGSHVVQRERARAAEIF